jgi:hypothetical protein
MASVDLVFAGAPLLTGNLVFGDDGSNPISDAVISGAIDAGAIALAGSVVLGIVASGAIDAGDVALSGEVVYYTDTRRPLVGQVAQRWQDTDPLHERTAQRFQDADPLPLAWDARWQDGVALTAGAIERWQLAQRTHDGRIVRYQDGDGLQQGVSTDFTDAIRLRNAQHVRYHDADKIQRGTVQRFQDGIRTHNSQHLRYQDALPYQFGIWAPAQSGRHLPRGWTTKYQDAWSPRPGRTVFVPDPPEVHVCYVPDGDLVFEFPYIVGDANLVFVCDVDEDEPPVEPGETIVVPVRRIYTVINTASLRRVVGDVLIPNLAMSLTIDVDSWTWSFTATVPGDALDLLEPSGGVPVEVEARINGIAYRAIVEGISRDRTFARSTLSVTGRGKSAVLDSPYAPIMSFGQADDRTVQQLANDVLSLAGDGVSPLGWDVDAGFAVDDWFVPAGVFSHRGTYMSALNAIAADAGAYVQPHRTAQAVSVLKRYPFKPWEWSGLDPDYELPSAVVQKEAIVWTDKPVYNRVYVRGMKAGKLARLTRSGTAGDIEAQMITAQLGCDLIGLRQRGVPILADTGRQAAVSLRLPVLPETGIIPPGKFVRYVDGGVERIGLTRSVTAEVARSEKKLTIWQTIGVETHV